MSDQLRVRGQLRARHRILESLGRGRYGVRVDRWVARPLSTVISAGVRVAVVSGGDYDRTTPERRLTTVGTPTRYLLAGLVSAGCATPACMPTGGTPARGATSVLATPGHQLGILDS